MDELTTSPFGEKVTMRGFMREDVSEDFDRETADNDFGCWEVRHFEAPKELAESFTAAEKAYYALKQQLVELYKAEGKRLATEKVAKEPRQSWDEMRRDVEERTGGTMSINERGYLVKMSDIDPTKPRFGLW